MYRVLKPHLVAVYAAHLAGSNPVYEPPTRRILERCLADERRHVADGEAVLDALARAPRRPRARCSAWERELRGRLDDLGRGRPGARRDRAPRASGGAEPERAARSHAEHVVGRDPRAREDLAPGAEVTPPDLVEWLLGSPVPWVRAGRPRPDRRPPRLQDQVRRADDAGGAGAMGCRGRRPLAHPRGGGGPRRGRVPTGLPAPHPGPGRSDPVRHRPGRQPRRDRAPDHPRLPEARDPPGRGVLGGGRRTRPTSGRPTRRVPIGPRPRARAISSIERVLGRRPRGRGRRRPSRATDSCPRTGASPRPAGRPASRSSGPPPEVLRTMGEKTEARRLVARAGRAGAARVATAPSRAPRRPGRSPTPSAIR